MCLKLTKIIVGSYGGELMTQIFMILGYLNFNISVLLVV